jgi:hypothetical protein
MTQCRENQVGFLPVIDPPFQGCKNLGDDDVSTIVKVWAQLIGEEDPRRPC